MCVDAQVHACRVSPARHDLLPLRSVQGNDMENLNLAFEVAEKHLDIPKMLDAEGMVNAASSLCSVHTYAYLQ